MALVQTKTEIEYPESDGLPMGETDLHREWMIRIFDLLDHRCRDQQTYVACNLLVYYEEGEPSRFVVPDIFVAGHCNRGHRRTFKIWEEGTAPHVVFEVTSRTTRNEDSSCTPVSYESIGIKEFFLYDPTSDYPSTPLQGFRLIEKKFEPVQADSRGNLESRELDLRLSLDDGQLVLHDRTSGERLRTAQQAAEDLAVAAEERAATAEKRAEAEAQARRKLEEELRRLRDQQSR